MQTNVHLSLPLLWARRASTLTHSILSFLLMLSGLLIGSVSSHAQSKPTIKICILDQESKEPIPGAIVKYRNHSYSTGTSGEIHLSYDRALQTVTLSITCLGYKPIVKHSYSINGGKTLTIYLQEHIEEIQQSVEVIAQRRHTSVLQQAVAVDRKTIEKSTALSLAKMLEQVPGVSSISSGGTIAKPVIQGMHSSRILLMNNGVRLESQSWGVDHAPEIDHTGASIVEVIKGADAVRYGHGAMGGVVLFNQAPLAEGTQRLRAHGRINLGYASNGRAYDGSGSLELNYKKVGLRLHAMYQRSGDYATAEYLLNNTGYTNVSGSALLGYRDRHLDLSLYASLYTSRSGVYYASKISDIDQLLARFEQGRPSESSLRPFSYAIEPPFQQTQHVTIKGEAKYRINPQHSLNLKVAYQDNLRQEYENRKQKDISWLPMQDLMLTTFSGDAVWDAKWKPLAMNTQVGASWMYQYNYNIPGTKQPAFIPNFTALTLGAFAIHKLTLGKLLLSLGIRYDLRAQAISGYTTLSSYKYYDDFNTYRNFTGLLAAHYTLSPQLEARANIGWSWRPPDINELYASGLHHGTYWVVGNKQLSAERGVKSVLGLRYRTNWLEVAPSAFYQRINNYIYDAIGKGAERFHNHPTGKFPKFVYGQDDARIVGGDLLITIRPISHLSISAKGEWIYARNLSQDSWLPFMPSDRYGVSGSYEWSFGRQKRWTASIVLDGTYVTQQRRFDPAKDLVPHSPDPYFLLNASADLSYQLQQGRSIKFLLIGDNVLNALYKEYTDRFRFYAHSRGAQLTFRTIISL